MQAIAAFEALDMSAENHNALTAPLTPPPTPPNTLTTDGPGEYPESYKVSGRC